MKITPQDIRHIDFKTSMLGYRKSEVKDFLKDVQKQLEQLLYSLREKEDEVSQLEKLLDEHRHREVTLKQTVVSAQRVSEEIKRNSQKEAEIVIEQAELQAERILAQAHMRLKDLISEIQDVKKQKINLVVGLKSLLEGQRKFLELIENEHQEKHIEDIALLPKKY